MASTINASTSAGLVSTADTSGVLQLQTAGTTAVSIDASQAVTFSAGTANGVSYLNGSKVLTTGSALTFDGSYFTAASGTGSFLADILQVSGIPTKVNANGVGLELRGGTTPSVTGYNRTTSAYLPFTLDASTSIFSISGSEQMRLTSTGLGIGTSSPGYTLDVEKSSDGTIGYFRRIGATVNPALTIYANETGNTVGFGTDYAGATSPAITFSIAASEKMRLDASGNLGLGVTPNASAILDAQSTTKGVRMPNMTTTQKNAISSPAAGLMVFDTTLAKLCVYSGSAWQTITSV